MCAIEAAAASVRGGYNALARINGAVESMRRP
jgi:hypothetical protein